MRTVDEHKLRRFCDCALTASGMSEQNAEIMSDVLVTTDKWGVYTHGTKNLDGYVLKAQAGGVSFSLEPEVTAVFPSMAVIDGHNTMGYLSAVKAMDLACDLAKETGIAIVLVKNSSHFGATGYYSNRAAMRGMIGLSMTNVDKKMTIPGAKGIVMGHNPLALSAPATLIPSIILDISSSNVASLKVLKAKAAGSLIPETWISDKDGVPTNDPSKYPEEGALLPFGNHKGYGIAIFVEILTSVMLAQPLSTGNDVNSWCFDLDKPNNVCHCFVAVDPGKLGPLDEFKARVDRFIEDLHSAPKAKDSQSITVPGENMWKRFYKAEKQGIPLPEDVIAELEKLAARSGLKLDIFKE